MATRQSRSYWFKWGGWVLRGTWAASVRLPLLPRSVGYDSRSGPHTSAHIAYGQSPLRHSRCSMPNPIPDTHKDLLGKPLFANLGTTMPNGAPQVTPVWFDYDGKNITINTAVGRQKDRNMQRDGRVALSIMDPANPYRYIEVRGTVVERTEQGADAVIDHLAKKYLHVDKYPYRQPGEKRITYKI